MILGRLKDLREDSDLRQVDIADFLGDSLELCIKASEIEDKDLVVFCGVDFMAETAYILNPDKKRVIPDLEAECPMAHMLPEEELLERILTDFTQQFNPNASGKNS